ncbi:MAG: P-loop NTPase [Haloplanus sp.]
MGRVYAVASGKGGVGKTTTVANLGAILAASGHETVVVDADLGMGNLAGVLGVDADAGPTVHDVLAGTATVEAARREGPCGLGVLPASADLDAFGAADPTSLRGLLDAIDAETVLVDTSAGLSHDSIEPLRVADEVVLVSTPERGAVGDTAKTREVAERLGTPVAGVVVTRATPESDTAVVADRLDVPILATIPDDRAVSRAAEAGDVLVTAASESPATDGYRRLAATLTGDESFAPTEPADEDVERGEDGAEPTSREAEATDADEATEVAGEAAADADADAEAEPEGTESVQEEADNGRTGFLRWLLP